MITAGGINVQQSELIKLILGTMGVNLLGRIIYSVLFGALCVMSDATTLKQQLSVGGINFALSRYKRFCHNLLARLAIQIGMIIVSGVLSWMQFAFVEPVAVSKSSMCFLPKRLTKGRRKSIFLIILPWIVFSQVFEL